MAIVVTFEFSEPIEKYHRILELGGDSLLDQPDRFSHVCYRTNAGFAVLDVWKDEASFQRFGETLMPILHLIGISADPLVYECVNTVDQSGHQSMEQRAA